MTRACRLLAAWSLLSTLALLTVLAWWLTPQILRTGADEAPLNAVTVDARLITAGQPSAAQLAQLGARGYGLVINLAPPQSFGSIGDEGARVAAQGIAYVNIPVAWEAPSVRDFDQFSAVLAAAPEHRALVHCQMNMRASVFAFLYRVVHESVPVEQALEAVHAVWVPNDTWRRFMADVLARHGVRYDPLTL